MAKDLDLTKVSENLTPKERAKLVITLRLKGIEEIKDIPLDELKERARKQTLPTQADITKIVNACPQEQIREYNAYIELEHRVRNKVLMDILFDETWLDLIRERISQLRYALGISPITSYALDMVKRLLPHLVTKEEYEEGLKRAREIIRSEVLPLEGKENLAEQEAYCRLKKEGKIKEESTDHLTGWLAYIEKYGKTREELIDKAVKGVKYGLEQHLKYKQRTGGEDRYWKYYKKYEGISEKELREAVIKDYSGTDTDISERITAQPTKEEYELWQKTVKEERERILQAVKDGRLKWVKRKEKKYDRETKSFKWEEVEGVETGSYYDWKERHQKYAGEEGGEERGYNPLAEDCIELRYIEGKGVVYANDPSLTEEEEEKEELIAIVPPNQEIGFWGSPKMVEVTKEGLKTYLEALLPVRVDKDVKKYLKGNDTAGIRLSSQEVEKALKAFVKKATEIIKNIHNHIALVEVIEKKHFDGMQIVSRDPKHPIGEIARALAFIERVTKEHNEHLRGIVRQFNKLDWGSWEYKFEGLEELLINPNQEPDQKWVEETLAEIEEEAGIND